MAQNDTVECARGSDETPSLTDRQLAALPYVVASPSLSEAARAVNIGRRTLQRWMNDDEFRVEVENLRSQASDLAHAELRGLMLKSVMVLADAMEDPSPRIRVRAAQATLSMGLKALDLNELQRRLDRLDDAYSLWARRDRTP